MLVVKKIPDSLIYALAIIGVCALLYGGWTIYQHYAAQEEAGEFFSAPSPLGLPDPLHAKPHPPPQP